jgi:hypothetical protein
MFRLVARHWVAIMVVHFFLIAPLDALLPQLWRSNGSSLRFIAGAVICGLLFTATANLGITLFCRVSDWRHRVPPGCCPECGYDLRASKDRCPECGRRISRIEMQNSPGNTTIGQ